MRDTELHRLLKAAAAPPRAESYWTDFPERVLRRLQRRLPAAAWTVNPWPGRLAWTSGLAVILVLAAFLAGRHLGLQQTADDNGQILQSAKFINEVTAMFPNRVRAVVQNGTKWQIVLSDQTDVPVSPPIWVKVCAAGRCTALVTFSGQEVEIAGQKMTVLAEADNGVILVGDRFAWASDGPKEGVRDLKIQARTIQMASR